MVSEEGLDGDAVGLVEGDGLVESGQDVGSFFIWENGGKSQAAVVIDGDMEGLGACAWITVGAIARGADARLMKPAQFLDIQVKEFTWSGAFITDDRRLWRVEGSQSIEAVAFEDAGKGSFRDGKDHEDLSIGTALAAQGEDLGFKNW